MSAGAIVGTVGELWRFPVKSMLGERPRSVDLGEHGVVGDRAHALVDIETGKVVSAKHPARWPAMFQCRASFEDPPAAGEPLPPVRIDLPDGSSVTSDDPQIDVRLSEVFGRAVTLASAAPEDFTIDDYHPDVAGLGPGRIGDTVTETKLGAAFFAHAGLPSAVPAGSFFDLFPCSVVTTSTLDELARREPDSRFDVRRFRMNVLIDSAADGFIENEWLGHRLRFAGGASVDVVIPDPRCVMTTLAQGDLSKDNGVLRAAARHNRVDVAGQGLFPCVGVYASVVATGEIRQGDPVTLLERARR